MKGEYSRKKYETLTWAIDVRLYVLPKLQSHEEKTFWHRLLTSRCKRYGLLKMLRSPLQTRYYYVDECDDYAVSQYENEKAFLEGMFWNRSVAKEYGDKVPTIREIKDDLAHPIADEHFNGAYFLKLTGITPDEYMNSGYVYAHLERSKNYA